MTDNKLTDNEIIKALECCSSFDKECKGCPLERMFACSCINYNCKYALDLINRLQAEKSDLEIELKAMRGAANSYKAENKRLGKVVEYNQGIIDVLFTDNAELLAKQSEIQATVTTNMLRNMELAIETAKTEAYKECIEKVKEYYKNKLQNYQFNYDAYCKLCEDLDNLLKESVGE